MAFLQPTTVPLSFQGGINSKTDALQLQPPALLELKNAQFSKIGQLNKRPGYDILSNQVSDGSNITSAVAIDNYNDELNLFDNSNIYTYISSNNNWVNRGSAISLINKNNQILRMDTAQQINPDANYLLGIELYAWEDTRGGIRYSVIDTNTNAYVISDKQISNVGTKPKILIFNNLFYIFYYDGANSLWYVTINPRNPQILSTQIALISDCMLTNFTYDATISAVDGYCYIAYTQTDGSVQNLNVFRIDSSITRLYTFTTIALSDVISCISITLDSANIRWVSWGQTASGATSIQVGGLNPSPSLYPYKKYQISNDLVITNIASIESTNPGYVQVIYEVNAAQSYNTYIISKIVSWTGIITDVGSLRSVGIATKPFVYNNQLFLNIVHQSNYQSTYFTVFLTQSSFAIVGKVNAQVGGGLRTNAMLAEVAQPELGIFMWPNLVKGQFISEDNTSFTLLGVNSTKTDFTDVNKFNSVTFLNNLLFVGGILQSYDGTSVVEQNFHLFPENIIANPNGGGGALSAGQYQYQVVYAWSDKFGQIQYSTTSGAITVTTIQNDSVALVIPTLRLTAKKNVVIKIYRTQVNAVTFQEVTSELAPLQNDPFADTVLFEDAAADIDIAGNQTLYTTGGIVDNAAPPSCSMITLYQDRVMVSGLEDPNLIWFSKNRVNNTNFNTMPAEFSAALTISIAQTGGRITALAVMDQSLIIFKESAIYLLSGDGPNDEGGGDVFPDPQLITKSVGCTNPNSIVFYDAGIMFQTPNKGIWMIPRSVAAPTYIGSPVDDIALKHEVSSAVADQNSSQIIFTTYDGDAMVYDYFINQWCTWTNHNATDGIVFNGNFAFVKANGNVYVQNQNNFYDGILNGNQVGYQLELVTPWISYSQILGYQSIFRAYLLGTYKSPHSLQVDIGYDFNSTFSVSATIDASATVGSNTWGSDGYFGDSTPWGGTYEPYIFQVNFPRQKCTSFRMRFSDVQTGSFYESYTISSLLFELGQMPLGVRMPATKKVGAQ